MTGQIKTLVPDRGFGFILGESGTEFFFHRSAVESGDFSQLKPGDRVSFEEELSAKGPRASSVVRVAR